MSGARPDPDELLARVRDAEERALRGKLTVFFGAAPGVGKTYAMLEAARSERDLKRDVVIGIVETHGRYETASLVLGLELLPRRKVEYRGITLEELDVDAALARRPGLILIDELAHTNAEGCRHAKRWQDVEELLDSGIDVYTTLNVQHLESLNDVVAEITGVVVRETVPDSVFDRAYEVRVIDLPASELLERLHDGKVYVPQEARRATENFFQEGNLIALRELALRRTAERVDAQMRGYKAAHGIQETWHTGERILVCVSPSPHSARLVRAARRMASSLHAELVGVYVETPASIRMSATSREQLAHNMRLVEALGGDAVVLRGEHAAHETIRYARTRNVTKIVVGKPTHARWRDFIRPSFLDDVVRRSEDVDVYVISGSAAEGASVRLARPVDEHRSDHAATGYVAGTGVVFVSALVSWFLFGRDQLTDVAMVILLGVVIVAMRFGYGPSLLAAVLGVFAFDFFFVTPYLSFAVSDFRHVVTFAVMFVVAVVISHLTTRIRDQADSARDRERRTASLYALSREASSVEGMPALLEAAARHVRDVFGVRVAFLLPRHDDNEILEPALVDEDTLTPDDKELGVTQWVWVHQKPAGRQTDTLPSARSMVVPLRGARGRVGVLALFPSQPASLRGADERHLLDTFAGLIGSAMERILLAEEARGAKVRMETEQLRNALLSSVSHDLRTPLAVVTGATSALLAADAPKDEATRRELLETAHEEAQRLNRRVRNLLDMTRLEAGALHVHKSLGSVEEIVGSALNRVEDRLRDRSVEVRIPSDLPFVPLDAALIEQVLINLLENATKYTPPRSPIDIEARERDGWVEIDVADRGPGVPPSETERIFDKFYRAKEREGGGVGLGLTICRGIAVAHGGRMGVVERSGGGAVFRLTLPLQTA